MPSDIEDLQKDMEITRSKILRAKHPETVLALRKLQMILQAWIQSSTGS